MQFKVLALAAILPAAMAAPAFLQHRAPGWSIRSFERDCTDANACSYSFGIDIGDGMAPTACTVVDHANPATNHSFYNAPCQQQTPYSISWGWDYANDFTVMTVVNEDNKTEAFFGYNNPNAVPAANFTDVGPNASQPV